MLYSAYCRTANGGFREFQGPAFHTLLYLFTVNTGCESDYQPNFTTYGAVMGAGYATALGGIAVKIGYSFARKRDYRNAASSYNEYLRTLYRLPAEE